MSQPFKELAELAESFYAGALRGGQNLAAVFHKSITADEAELVSVLWSELSRSVDYSAHDDSISHDHVGDNPLRDAMIRQPVQGLQLVEVFTGVLRRNMGDAELKSFVPQGAKDDAAAKFRTTGAHNLAAVFAI